MHCGKPEFLDEKQKENDLPLHPFMLLREKMPPRREYVDKVTEILRQIASKGHLCTKCIYNSRVELVGYSYRNLTVQNLEVHSLQMRKK